MFSKLARIIMGASQIYPEENKSLIEEYAIDLINVLEVSYFSIGAVAVSQKKLTYEFFQLKRCMILCLSPMISPKYAHPQF